MNGTRFPIRIGRRAAPLLRVLFGVTADRAWAEVSDGWVSARFGRFEITIPVDQVVSWRIEGPWHAITAVGVRRSVRHGDVTFAGAAHGGVRIDLRAPVRWTALRVPAFYLGVDDLEGFAAALAELGIPGQDARSAR